MSDSVPQASPPSYEEVVSNQNDSNSSSAVPSSSAAAPGGIVPVVDQQVNEQAQNNQQKPDVKHTLQLAVHTDANSSIIMINPLPEPLSLRKVTPGESVKAAVAAVVAAASEDGFPDVTKPAKEHADDSSNQNKAASAPAVHVVSAPATVPVAPPLSVASLQQVAPIVTVSESAADICCVVDVSGSMSFSASSRFDDGLEGQHVLSPLDLVKHSVLTIIESLSEHQRLSVVTFATNVFTLFELMKMTPENKKIARAIVKGMRPLDSTNLWGGLQQGLNLLNNNSSAERHPTILLLTDGEPNIHPPRGELPTLRAFLKKETTKFIPQIHTFGFGYNVKATLLSEIAEVGFGTYSFIPDVGMVGTVFINALTDILSTCAVKGNLTLTLRLKEVQDETERTARKNLLTGLKDALAQSSKHCGSKWARHLDKDQAHTSTSADSSSSSSNSPDSSSETTPPAYNDAALTLVFKLFLPSFVYGRERRIYVPFSFSKEGIESCEVTLSYHVPVKESAEAAKSLVLSTNQMLSLNGNEWYPLRECLKLEVLDCIEQGKLVRSEAGDLTAVLESKKSKLTQAIEKRKTQLKNDAAADDYDDDDDASLEEKDVFLKYFTALLADITGQITLALTVDKFFSKWGHLYLPALYRAHQLEFVNNFKDPGLQCYSTKYYESIRDVLDEIFNTLPAPVAESYSGPFAAPSSSSSSSSVSKPFASFSNSGSASAKASNAIPAPAPSMRRWNNVRGGCFAADTMITLADGSSKKIQQLRQGDAVLVPATANPVDESVQQHSNITATVKYLVVSRCNNEPVEFNKLSFKQSKDSDLFITPWHPVYSDADHAWHFPADLVKDSQSAIQSAAVTSKEEFIYNLVLSEGHVVLCNGLHKCVTMGHNFTADVVKHPYFGSSAIVDDLNKIYEAQKTQEKAQEGVVMLNADAFKRNAQSGMIEKIEN